MANNNASSPDKEFLNGETPHENGIHHNKVIIQLNEEEVLQLQKELFEEA